VLKKIVFGLVALFSLPVAFAASKQPAAQPTEPPRLVLQITVDQLRGDMLSRYYTRFGQDGFRRLTDKGTWFANANYGSANTLTCPGHAVLVTGADAAQHGIPANEWLDRHNGYKAMYCVSDPTMKVVGANEGAGMSPANLTSTTIGDEIVLASGNNASMPRSRAFGVAGKDRSAIVPGGHLGRAYWYSEETGAFVTSSYYTPELPAWAIDFNKGKPVQSYRKRQWTPVRDINTYRFAKGKDNPNAHPALTLGRAFPHSPDSAKDREFYSMLRFTPMLDDYTNTFVKELITREKLGQSSGITDYLAISFSSTDYVGHSYGPNSVEYEDNLIRLDALLESLFAFVDKQVGAGRTVIVLSADHGADDIPEERSAAHYDADRLPSRKSVVTATNAFLQAQFKTTENLVANYSPPGLYLDDEALRRANLTGEAVERALSDYAVKNIAGVAYAITRTDLLNGRLTHTAINDKIQRAFHPDRSGDVTLIQKPFWYMDSERDRYAAMHGSPYSYDTFVPMIFYGAGIPAQRVIRDVEPASIAPTLAALLRIRPPSGSSAPVLPEIVTSAR
jgi:predicted AlkP superfamily pyrophosphatase or phosphodiesterase